MESCADNKPNGNRKHGQREGDREWAYVVEWFLADRTLYFEGLVLFSMLKQLFQTFVAQFHVAMLYRYGHTQ